MSTQLMVDTDKIKSVAARMENIMASIRANVKTAKEAIAGLEKGWKSEVKDEFFRQVRIDLEAMDEMEQQYDEVIQCLQALLGSYDGAEQESASNLKSKKR